MNTIIEKKISKRKADKRNRTHIGIHIFFIVFALICILPMLSIITASLTSDADLVEYGFSILPRSLDSIDTSAYAYLFENPKEIINGYCVTIFITVVGTFLSVLVMSMMAYALARPQFMFRNFVAFFIFIPTLFSGGMASSYIINTKYLGLTDSIWVLILPGLVSVFHVFMIRTFFKGVPDGLFDAAQIDGANELKIYFRIALPLSKPVIATVAFLGALGRWNTWYNAMLYIRSSSKYPLQYLLQRIMLNLQELIENIEHIPGGFEEFDIPGESLRMALLIVCIGPIMCFFPFFQKYFTKGMTVGGVKG